MATRKTVPSRKSTAGKAAAKKPNKNRADTAPARAKRKPSAEPEGPRRIARQGQAADRLAASLDHNPNKAAEHGRADALTPPEGAHAGADAETLTSTLGETNAGAKNGAPAQARRSTQRRPEPGSSASPAAICDEEIITLRLPLSRAEEGYKVFDRKQEDCRKVVLVP